MLHRALNANITIYMNPREKLSEPPLKTYEDNPIVDVWDYNMLYKYIPHRFTCSFYRFVLDPQMEFEADGSRILPVALFESLPEKSLFTLGMDAPHSWMVRSFALELI